MLPQSLAFYNSNLKQKQSPQTHTHTKVNPLGLENVEKVQECHILMQKISIRGLKTMSLYQ